MFFSPNSEWFAGTANDKLLHMWQLSNPPGLSNKPLFPGEYLSSPVVDFSLNGRNAAAVAPDGAVYVWSLDAPLNLSNPIGRLYSGARVRFSDDSTSLYSADLRSVYLTRVGGISDLVSTTESRVQAISNTPDSEQLAIFTEHWLLLATRRMYLWGIPLWPLHWPAMKEPLLLSR